MRGGWGSSGGGLRRTLGGRRAVTRAAASATEGLGGEAEESEKGPAYADASRRTRPTLRAQLFRARFKPLSLFSRSLEPWALAPPPSFLPAPQTPRGSVVLPRARKLSPLTLREPFPSSRSPARREPIALLRLRRRSPLAGLRSTAHFSHSPGRPAARGPGAPRRPRAPAPCAAAFRA